MSKQRNSPSQTLAALFKSNTSSKSLEKLSLDSKEWAALLECKPDLDDPMVHGFLASVAATLNPGDKSAAIVNTAFTKASLDPTNPLHWRVLLTQFCLAHFGKTKRRGAPQKWNADKYCQLLQDFDRKKSQNPSMSDDRVCEYLSKEGQYKMKNGKPLSADRLTRVLQKARDPKCNKYLESGIKQVIVITQQICQQRGLEWSSEQEEQLRKKMLANNLRRIASSWRRE